MSLVIILLVMLLMAIFGGLVVRDNEDTGMLTIWMFILIVLFVIGWMNHKKTMLTFEESIRKEAILRGHAFDKTITNSYGNILREEFQWYNIEECKHYEE